MPPRAGANRLLGVEHGNEAVAWIHAQECPPNGACSGFRERDDPDRRFAIRHRLVEFVKRWRNVSDRSLASTTIRTSLPPVSFGFRDTTQSPHLFLSLPSSSPVASTTSLKGRKADSTKSTTSCSYVNPLAVPRSRSAFNVLRRHLLADSADLRQQVVLSRDHELELPGQLGFQEAERPLVVKQRPNEGPLLPCGGHPRRRLVGPT